MYTYIHTNIAVYSEYSEYNEEALVRAASESDMAVIGEGVLSDGGITSPRRGSVGKPPFSPVRQLSHQHSQSPSQHLTTDASEVRQRRRHHSSSRSEIKRQLSKQKSVDSEKVKTPEPSSEKTALIGEEKAQTGAVSDLLVLVYDR